MVGGLGGDIGLGLRVDWGALVGDLSDVAVDVVGSVLHGLDPAVRKGDLVRARDNTVGIAGLSGVEVGLGVVIGNTVGVSVRLRGLLDNNSGCVVGGGGVDNGGSVHNGGSVDSVHQRGSMVGNSVVGNRVSNGVVGNRVGNGVSSVDKGSGVDNGSHMGGNTVADNGSVSNMGDMGDLGGGSGSKAEEGRDCKGLNLQGSRLRFCCFGFDSLVYPNIPLRLTGFPNYLHFCSISRGQLVRRVGLGGAYIHSRVGGAKTGA